MFFCRPAHRNQNGLPPSIIITRQHTRLIIKQAFAMSTTAKPEDPAPEPEQPAAEPAAEEPEKKSAKKAKKPSRGSMEGMIKNGKRDTFESFQDFARLDSPGSSCLS
jgi:cell division protein FtsN